MKRFRASLAMFMAGLPFLSTKAGPCLASEASQPKFDDADPVKLRPLNLPGDNLFAAHRSHSSHGSHRSGSGGGSVAPRVPAQPVAPPDGANSLYGSGTSRPTDPGRAAPVTPSPSQPKPKLSLEEKRRLQIMQVQIALTGLGIYSGAVDGQLNAGTKEALKLFQSVKGIEPTGLMTTDTLNALGVAAVQ